MLGAIVAVDKVRDQLAGDLREFRRVEPAVEYGSHKDGNGAAKEG